MSFEIIYHDLPTEWKDLFIPTSFYLTFFPVLKAI